ncbi:MAG: hypothetical protein VYE64_02690 [Planctomycetota bacterium]|nr:hypothetical protein [Planctomycetota bacterium]
MVPDVEKINSGNKTQEYQAQKTRRNRATVIKFASQLLPPLDRDSKKDLSAATSLPIINTGHSYFKKNSDAKFLSKLRPSFYVRLLSDAGSFTQRGNGAVPNHFCRPCRQWSRRFRLSYDPFENIIRRQYFQGHLLNVSKGEQLGTGFEETTLDTL